MTVKELTDSGCFEALCLPRGKAEIEGCYAGDLLSWVMGRAEAGCAWITIMTNNNIVAVASLIDMACIILAENTEPDEGTLALAESRGVNLLRSSLPVYESCLALHEQL